VIVISAPHAQLLQDVEQQLAALREFEPDWDGAGANAPVEEALIRAGRLVGAVVAQRADAQSRAIAPFAIAPLPDGGVLVEWRRPDQAIAVFVLANGRFDYLLTRGAGAQLRHEDQRNVARDGVTVLLGAFLKWDPETGENIPDPELSVNLARLTTAEATRDEAGRPGWGVCQFLAEVPVSLGLTVRHKPLEGNYAHSVLEGMRPDDRGPCVALARVATIVIPPIPPEPKRRG
jgi:hypothetical protein